WCCTSMRWDLNQFGELLLAERLVEKLQRYRLRHDRVDIRQAIVAHRLLGLELVPRHSRKLDRHVRFLGIDFDRVWTRKHPIQSLAVSARETQQRVPATIKDVGIDHVDADG